MRQQVPPFEIREFESSGPAGLRFMSWLRLRAFQLGLSLDIVVCDTL